jgi:intracellular sulfur oxidation DsrE/DsrF family protein
MNRRILALSIALSAMVAHLAMAQWPGPKAPAIPAADGYVVIPDVAVPPDGAHTYRAIFDAKSGPDKPDQLVPALNMAGSELNAFAVAAVPRAHVKFAVVFRGAAMDGLLNDTHYKGKFGVSNPNLPVLEQMKKAGVELFVCGQNVALEHMDPNSLSPAVTIASDALIVLMEYHDRGYALFSF